MAPHPPNRRDGDDGFTLIEQIIAIGLIATVLLGLLTVVATGARAINGGRQRTLATSLAKQVVETLQGSGYAEIAIEIDDVIVGGSVTVSGGVKNFEGEALVDDPMPLTPPVQPHVATTTLAGTTFTLTTYVTSIVPAETVGDPFKRITVLVSWPASGGSPSSYRFSS